MFNAKRTRAVAAPTSVAAGAATDVSDLVSATVQLSGTFTGTYQCQVCFDGTGTNFVAQASALTAPGSVSIPDGATHVRWNCTAYTSGTPASGLGGLKTALGGGI